MSMILDGRSEHIAHVEKKTYLCLKQTILSFQSTRAPLFLSYQLKNCPAQKQLIIKNSLKAKFEKVERK